MAASDEFLSRLLVEAQNLGTHPEVFLPTLYFESRGLDPSAVSPDGAHYGLNQLSKGTLVSYGINPPEQYLGWSDAAQVPVVMRFVRYLMQSFNGGQPFSDPVRFYIANFLPGRLHLATSEDSVLTASPESYYESNKGLDKDGKGSITVADIRKMIAQTVGLPGYQAVVARLRRTSPGGARGFGALLLALGLGVAALRGGGKRRG